MTLRANLFDGGNFRKTPQRINHNVIVLCGRGSKKNVTKSANKKTAWTSNFTRRKKLEPNPKTEESKSLAVYGPRTSRSNTVWQIDLKDKLWTSYVCCCDTSNSEKRFSKTLEIYANVTKNETEKSLNGENQTKSTWVKNKIDKTEDRIEAEQQHMNISNSKIKKKKINQVKKKTEIYSKKIKNAKLNNEDPVFDAKEHVSLTDENREIDYLNSTRTIHIFENLQVFHNDTALLPSKNPNDVEAEAKKQKEDEKSKTLQSKTQINGTKTAEQMQVLEEALIKNKTGNVKVNNTGGERVLPKIASKYCPDFPENGQPVSWCDGNNDVLITSDLNSPNIVLWLFDLKTSHWSQQEVSRFQNRSSTTKPFLFLFFFFFFQIKVARNTVWPACSDLNSIRYAGNGEEVFILCSPQDIIHENYTLPNETSEPSKNPSDTSKLVFRIDSRRKILESLGRIELSDYFKSPENEEVWENETKSMLHVLKTSDNLTVLVFAYEDSVDLWVLVPGAEGKSSFEKIENIYRGSALKWFNKYNAALYNLQFVSDSTEAFETVFIPNPRSIGKNEYWPRERGKFIIRIFKNENVKNKSFENRTRDQNLTYELLQSDFKPSSSENAFVHSYSIKMLIFFGISLAIFATFGFVIFFKRCVTCPTRIRLRNKCQKSPPIIRYSVIPDDLLYPVA